MHKHPDDTSPTGQMRVAGGLPFHQPFTGLSLAFRCLFTVFSLPFLCPFSMYPLPFHCIFTGGLSFTVP